MSKTATFQELLTVCIQDLHKGETMLADALPKIARKTNAPALARLLEQAEGGARRAADALAETGRHKGGASNLWMAGIVDDADRDTRSVEPGPLLDAALVGAIRKAKAAQIVSYDTAIAIAGVLDETAVVESLRQLKRAAMTINRRLSNRLPGAG